VVSRLFDIVKADMAFFGQKDYQQVMIIKALVRLMNYTTEIVACPIIREPDGLAMSSRNVLLSREEREAASHIPLFMKRAKELFGIKRTEEIKEEISEMISRVPLLKPDYFEICDRETLEVYEGEEKNKAVALLAVYSGKIRLIDNILL